MEFREDGSEDEGPGTPGDFDFVPCLVSSFSFASTVQSFASHAYFFSVDLTQLLHPIPGHRS